MLLDPIATEVTSGATDALLALIAWGGAHRVARRVVPAARAAAWALVFRLLAAASALGAVAHALALSDRARAALWQPLYLLLGLVVAAFLAAALGDLRGEAAGRRWRLPLLALGGAFYLASVLARGAFVVFVAYEAVAMVLALGAYVALAARHRLPGAGVVAAGIVLDLVAAGVQASTLAWHVGLPLDHNGLFHVAQAVALLVMLRGLGAGASAAVTPSGSS